MNHRHRSRTQQCGIAEFVALPRGNSLYGWCVRHRAHSIRRPKVLKHFLLFVVFSVLLLAFGFACKDTPPSTDGEQPITLVAEDTGVTEVALRVRVEPSVQVTSVAVVYGAKNVVMPMHTNFDTLVWIDSLEPATEYTFQAELRQGTLPVVLSEPLVVTTMDTSSHSFSWETVELGDGWSHGFQDVAIINDTCIWAVGELFKWDSTLAQYFVYNAAHWDGRQWDLIRVNVKLTYASSVIVTDQDPLTCIYAPTPDDLWFVSSAGGVTRYKDTSWVLLSIPYPHSPGGAHRVWGTDTNNLYFAGNNGRLTHYDGQSWTQLESGTDLDITDIYGATNPRTDELEVLAVASKSYENYERAILKITGTTVKTLSDSGIISHWLGIPTSVTSVWFVPGQVYYVTGDGVFTKRKLPDTGEWQTDPGSYASPYYKAAVRGNGSNDIIVVGDEGTCLHFDGVHWRSFLQQTYLPSGSYRAVAMRGNLVIAVGYNNGYGVITTGRR